MDNEVLNRRQVRWAMLLAEYDFQIVFREGKKMKGNQRGKGKRGHD